ELDRPVFVMEGGKRRRRNYQQILLRKMVHQAVKGDSRQLENILKSMLRIEEPMDPDFPKGKARDYLHKLMCDVITKQRKLGYSERVAEEAEERDSANSKGDDEDES
ncbi:MAG: hypothetical protein ABJA10_11500, partial [Aestuariivirga sp.]